MTDLKQEFWNRIKDVRAGLLGLADHPRLVPMSPKLDEDHKGHVWFITAKSTELAQGTEAGERVARFAVADSNAGLYADVAGTLSRSADREALDDVWDFVASAWFEGDKHDPEVCLLKFTPSMAEVSVTPKNGVKFLYEIGKAHAQDTQPDMGAQGRVAF